MTFSITTILCVTFIAGFIAGGFIVLAVGTLIGYKVNKKKGVKK